MRFVSPKENAAILVEVEIEEIAAKLLKLKYDVSTDRKKSIGMDGEGNQLVDYYNDLDWLLNLLNGTSISVNEKLQLHNKLKTQLISFQLIENI